MRFLHCSILTASSSSIVVCVLYREPTFRSIKYDVLFHIVFACNPVTDVIASTNKLGGLEIPASLTFLRNVVAEARVVQDPPLLCLLWASRCQQTPIVSSTRYSSVLRDALRISRQLFTARDALFSPRCTHAAYRGEVREEGINAPRCRPRGRFSRSSYPTKTSGPRYHVIPHAQLLPTASQQLFSFPNQN